MDAKIVIAVSGLHGAGRSTQAKMIASEFKLRYVSAGSLFREYCTRERLNLGEASEKLRNDPTLDNYIDSRTREEASKGSVVLEGDLVAWMAGEFADVKIFLTASDNVRFKRLAKREGKSIEEVAKETMQREANDRFRYSQFYGIDFQNLSIYDIVLNTDRLPAESIFRVLKTLIDEYVRLKTKQSSG
ncbi:MAG: cytidylate kinase family protein [Candidatus Bathyarchaeia archaeon]